MTNLEWRVKEIEKGLDIKEQDNDKLLKRVEALELRIKNLGRRIATLEIRSN